MKTKRFFAAAIAFVMLAALGVCPAAGAQGEAAAPHTPATGQIYLYGEAHSVEKILDKEFELWRDYYQNQNMRHLFIEQAYYTAQFLNLWMQSDSNFFLDAVYDDWADSQAHDPANKAFYKRIKSECPETIFHGTDVGHQYDTTGERYLAHLARNGMKDSEEYLRAQEVIEQGKYYYSHPKDGYRENKMTENFIREFDTLDGENIMGIYGSAHTAFGAMSYGAPTVPNMASQLQQRYGDIVHSEDLTLIMLEAEPIRVDSVSVNGKTYEASYFGKQDLNGFQGYAHREYWRLENAYDDFKDMPRTGNVLPYDNYLMAIETGQVFVIDYAKANGTVERQYLRSDGLIWNGKPATEEFTIE